MEQRNKAATEKTVPTREEELESMIGNMNDDDKYDKLSNKQMLDIMGGAVESALKANAAQVKDDVMLGLQPNLEKVGNLEKVTMQIAANLGVQQARTQYPDFDKHAEDIKKVLEVYPGMDYGDAYLLATGRQASSKKPDDQINTEKPGSSAVIPDTKPNPTKMTDANMQEIANRGKDTRGEVKHGIVAFREAISDAADKVLSERE